MGHLVRLNDIHLICNEDLECNSKVLNSYCDRNSSCVCERGYRYYSKLNKCIFSNHFHCNNVQQCANLDPRLTCNDNFCTCKEKEKRADSYLCSSFRKYCYKGYRYNVETTDCVFVGDLTINNQLENLDQSVEIFVIVLFFITSALFIASCINNYKNERAEKLRRRIARQQAISLFAEQRGRLDLNSGSITEVINLTNNNLYTNDGQLRNGSRNNSRNQSQFRHSQHRMLYTTYQKYDTNAYDDLPPTYDEVMRMVKNEDNSKCFYLANVNNLTEQQIDYPILEESSNFVQNNSADLINQTDQCLNNSDNSTNNMTDSVNNSSIVTIQPTNLNNNSDNVNYQSINHLDDNMNHVDNNTNVEDKNNSRTNLNSNDICHINDSKK